MESKFSDIKNENEKLVEFKNKVEKEQKEAILTKYEQYLGEENVQKFTSEMANYSVDEFKKEVCTAAVESDATIFSNRESQPQTFYKGGSPDVSKGENGILRILEKHKNGGNK